MANTIPPGCDIDDLAEDFARRMRAGERPSVAEYVQRHPQMADELRSVLSAVAIMEQVKPSDPPLLVHQPELRMPAVLGEYRILRKLGHGGMGIVYEAVQETLGRHVAVKVMPPQLMADEKMRSRFRREAQAAARLHHTNIVPVFAVGEENGLCYYAMQLIQGRGLDAIIRDRRDSLSDEAGDSSRTAILQSQSSAFVNTSTERDLTRENHVLVNSPIAKDCSGSGSMMDSFQSQSIYDYCRTIARIGASAADALAHAHSQGVLHRDIKPSNLLLDESGMIWITDFGVAKLLEEAKLTQSREVVGTLQYVPPERFAGSSDARGDIYSLGVTLFELLTLTPAFPATSAQQLIQLIGDGIPTRPRKINRSIPTELETIVLKAAYSDPTQRYQTADDLANDLRRFLEDQPILARRTSLSSRLGRWARRNPALAATNTAILLLLAAVATGILVIIPSSTIFLGWRIVTRIPPRSVYSEARRVMQVFAKAAADHPLPAARSARIASHLGLQWQEFPEATGPASLVYEPPRTEQTIDEANLQTVTFSLALRPPTGSG